VQRDQVMFVAMNYQSKGDQNIEQKEKLMSELLLVHSFVFFEHLIKNYSKQSLQFL